MKDELKKFIDELFAEAPRSRAAYELKEELLANSLDRYYDLLKEGIPEQDAFDIVVGSIGNIDELFAAMENPEVSGQEHELTTKKVALLRAFAISLYIIGAAVIVGVDMISNSDVGVIIFLVLAAIATGILVYVGAAYPKYSKKDDTVVENFKEWNQNKKDARPLRSAISSLLWLGSIIVYFIISFLTGAWYITWLIFIAAACAQVIISLIFRLNEM